VKYLGDKSKEIKDFRDVARNQRLLAAYQTASGNDETRKRLEPVDPEAVDCN